MDVLLLSEGSHFAYRVLKTAVAAGARVHVLASPKARMLGWSRRTASLSWADRPFALEDAEPLTRQINQVIAQRGIECVVAGDAPTTRFMIGVADRLEAPIFPSPDLATFELLNDKWRFNQLAAELGLPCPASRLFADRDELARAHQAGELPGPGIVKPLSQSGGAGVHRLDEAAFDAVCARINYAPILWQSFIPGPQWDVSAFCRDGEVVAFSVRRRARGEFIFRDSPELRRQTAILARRLNISGILDFDIIADEELTQVSWLECNPRVFFSIDFVAAAGVNMIALGLGQEAPAPALAPAPAERIRKFTAMARALMRGEALAAPDVRMLLADLSDPAMFLRDRVFEAVAGLRGLAASKTMSPG